MKEARPPLSALSKEIFDCRRRDPRTPPVRDMGSGAGRRGGARRVLPASLARCLWVLVVIPRLRAEPAGCAPPQVENADRSGAGASVGVNGAVTYACKPGFRLVGKDTLTCTSDAEWSDAAPQCDPYCGKPPPQGNAKLSSQYSRREVYFVDQYAYFVCDEGFASPAKGFYMVCARSGNGLAQWVQESNRTCTATRCDMIDGFKSGSFQGSNEIGSSVTFTCHEGMLVGDDKLTCLESGRWSSDVPTCQPFCTGERLEPHAAVAHAYDRRAKHAVGSSMTFRCSDSYRASGGGYQYNVLCRADDVGGAHWSAEDVCVPALCPKKCFVPHGQAGQMCEETRMTVGYVIPFTCDLGYRTPKNNRDLFFVCSQNSSGYPYWQSRHDDESGCYKPELA